MSDKNDKSLSEIVAQFSEAQKEYDDQYDQEADAAWNALDEDQKLQMFYSVVKRIYDGEIKQKGSYRYVLYDVFGFSPAAYYVGMMCGYLELHNAIVSEEDMSLLVKKAMENQNNGDKNV